MALPILQSPEKKRHEGVLETAADHLDDVVELVGEAAASRPSVPLASAAVGGSGLWEGVGDLIGTVAEGTGDVLGALGEGAGHLAEAVGEGVGNLLEGVGDLFSGW